MGAVFDVARFSLNDGPGIRTTVFLKGCPLDCVWCHNPESRSPCPQLAFFRDKCTDCGACGFCRANSFSPRRLNRECCTVCGKCVQSCPNGALKIYGGEMSACKIIETVKKDGAYYLESGGGVTISGGEPPYHPDFTLELLRLAKECGINTAVETSGYGDTEDIAGLLPYTDLFLFDYKASEKAHTRLTGQPRRLIDKNMEYIHEHGANIVLRHPVVTGVNDCEAELLEYRKRFPRIMAIERLPYHTLGESKKKALK